MFLLNLSIHRGIPSEVEKTANWLRDHMISLSMLLYIHELLREPRLRLNMEGGKVSGEKQRQMGHHLLLKT